MAMGKTAKASGPWGTGDYHPSNRINDVLDINSAM